MRIVRKLARSKVSSLAVGKMESLAVKMGVDEKQLLQFYIDARNNAAREKFAAVPYSERILLLPQCLRSRSCPAKLKELGYECAGCGECNITKIVDQTKKLGYKNIFIIPGGSVATKILNREKPKACLGVSCLKELVLGGFVCEKLGVAAQGIALLRDGCVETAVNWKKVENLLHLNSALNI
ncbi:MAG: DUF116 domain-containing protein [Candidatus Bathyarchaeota archaeon]|nr:MAG: DUF116 domain-containing protein [Candidatus Bathyarchaeota archaeon]